MQALVILESQQPDKPRAQLIGELLIARANNTEVEPTIEFAQLDDRELFSLRREIAENRKAAALAKAALRAATPGRDKDGQLLTKALKEFNVVLENCKKMNNTIMEMANLSASVKAKQIMAFEEVYVRAVNAHGRAVKQFGKDEEASKIARTWANLANFARLYVPAIGPEIRTPTAFPTEKGGKTTQQPEEKLEAFGGFTDA